MKQGLESCYRCIQATRLERLTVMSTYAGPASVSVAAGRSLHAGRIDLATVPSGHLVQRTGHMCPSPGFCPSELRSQGRKPCVLWHAALTSLAMLAQPDATDHRATARSQRPAGDVSIPRLGVSVC